MEKCEMGSSNESIPHNHEVLNIEGHLPNDLYKLLVDILLDNYDNLLLGQNMWPSENNEYLNGGCKSIIIP